MPRDKFLLGDGEVPGASEAGKGGGEELAILLRADHTCRNPREGPGVGRSPSPYPGAVNPRCHPGMASLAFPLPSSALRILRKPPGRPPPPECPPRPRK